MNKLEAIQTIVQMGGDVEFERRGDSDAKVTQVVLSEKRFRDKHLALLEPLAPFGFLGIGRESQITEAGIRSLARFTWLEKLSLYGSQIEDSTISLLSGVRGLTYFSLGKTRITDEGVAALRAFRSLSWLSLSETKV